VRGCDFRENRQVALELNGKTRCNVENSSFSRNGKAVSGHSEACGKFSDTLFENHKSAAVSSEDRVRFSFTDCRFQSNSVALGLNGSASLRLYRNYLGQQTTHGVFLQGKSRLQSTESEFEGNGGAGVMATDQANVRLSKNRFISNNAGVEVDGQVLACLTENSFQGQQRVGVSSASEGKVDVRHNYFFQNRIGMNHHGADRAFVGNNKFWKHHFLAAVFSDRAESQWAKNHCLENNMGVDCRGAARPVFRNNVFEKTGGPVFVVRGESAPSGSGNRFVNNRAVVAGRTDSFSEFRRNVLKMNEREADDQFDMGKMA
jgi:nitrous oxidase accessory protein NosD